MVKTVETGQYVTLSQAVDKRFQPTVCVEGMLHRFVSVLFTGGTVHHGHPWHGMPSCLP